MNHDIKFVRCNNFYETLINITRVSRGSMLYEFFREQQL